MLHHRITVLMFKYSSLLSHVYRYVGPCYTMGQVSTAVLSVVVHTVPHRNFSLQTLAGLYVCVCVCVKGKVQSGLSG